MSKLIMLCGLPASGKSTLAKKYQKDYNANIHSSDALREELYGNESNQENNSELFNILHKRIKEDLNNDINVVYDACNINSKRRKAFLEELKNIKCEKTCIIIATPYEICLDQNDKRKRKVPTKAINRMYSNWNTPYYFEGWNYILIEYNKLNYVGYYYENCEDFISSTMDFNQQNYHHALSLGEHCKQTYVNICNSSKYCKFKKSKRNQPVQIAGLIHDNGKLATKSFINSKGETTETAHYYNHQHISAYNTFFFSDIDKSDRLEVSVLCDLHMQPYFWEKEKTIEKYHLLWGDKLFKDVIRLHEADKKAH